VPNLLTVDFETYYDRSYSLSKLTTEEYVRDRQFQTIGVSVKRNDEPAEWFSGTERETKEWLDQWAWDSSIAIAHNAMFDMAILNWHFDIRPKRIADTLSMARALDGPDAGNSLAKLAARHGAGVKGDEVINALGKRLEDFDGEDLARYGAYCVNDVELTYKLFRKLSAGFPLDELKLIDLTIRMFTEPVLYLKGSSLASHLRAVKGVKESWLLSLGGKASKEQLMSNTQLAMLLQSYGIDPPTKTSPTTGKQTYAFSRTDEAFQALLDHENPVVQTLIAVRLGIKSTLEETRTERFLGIASRGMLPVPLRYYAAHTGRWGGCLVADTEVVVYNSRQGVQHKRIVDVLLDDLVWDGEEFVPHEGVTFSGYSEVIEWDGVTGTGDHVVFTDAGEMPLREAMQGAHHLKDARSLTAHDVDVAKRRVSNHKGEN
jgi:hypothetical protein